MTKPEFGRAGIRKLARLFLAIPLLVLASLAVAQPVQQAAPPVPPQKPPAPSVRPEANRPAPPTPTDNRGTAQSPLVVKVLPTLKTAEEARQDKQDREEKASAEWWMVRLTAALAIIGGLQFAAFVGQIIVFIFQAKRLRDSVTEMKRATEATRNVAQANRDQTNIMGSQLETMRQQADAMNSQRQAVEGLLHTTEAVAKAAEGNATAAMEHVKIAQSALTDVERSYVFFTKVSDPGFEIDIANNITMRGEGLKFVVTNHGKTPAMLTHVLMKDAVIQKSADGLKLPDPVNPTTEQGQRLPIGIALGAGGEKEMSHNLNMLGRIEEFYQVSHKTGFLFFMGYVRYQDIFRKRYRTGFCLIYDWSAEQFVSIGDEEYNYTVDEG